MAWIFGRRNNPPDLGARSAADAVAELGAHFVNAYTHRPAAALPLIDDMHGVLDDALRRAPHLAGEITRLRQAVDHAESVARTTPEFHIGGVFHQHPHHANAYQAPARNVDALIDTLRWRAYGSPDTQTWHQQSGMQP